MSDDLTELSEAAEGDYTLEKSLISQASVARWGRWTLPRWMRS